MKTTPNEIIRSMIDKDSVIDNKMTIDSLIETLSGGGEFDRLKAVNTLCRIKRNLAILEECVECDKDLES